MLWGASYLLLSTLCVMSLARPSQLDDIFADYLKKVNLYSPEKQSQIEKRQVYEGNQDESLKKVSLQSLIGNLEQNFLQSASSAGSLVHQTTKSTESHLNPIESHSAIKRKTESETFGQHKVAEKDQNKTVEDQTRIDLINASEENVSNKAPESTRLQVDKISVQPHFGNFHIAPTFQLHHTKLISATFKDTDSNPTQITITKTKIQSTPAQDKSETIHHQAEFEKQTDVNRDIKGQIEKNNNSKHPTTEEPENASSPAPSTTKNPVPNLKETEAELKANVAEIEAEPVILSARV